MNFLSISSHVVHGYVGNKAINMAIQFKPDVDNIDILNTVQLNTHPKYLINKKYADLAVINYDSETLINQILKTSLFEFLQMDYSCIILSYFNNAQGIDYLTEVLMNKQNKDTKIILDPIMGDNGKLYCNPMVVKSYKNLITNLDIDCILPNQFELELLVNDEYNFEETKNDKYFAELIKKFHDKYPKVQNLIVTSVMINKTTPYILISSTLKPNMIRKINLERFYLKDTIIYGCGDLFTGLIAYEYTKNMRQQENDIEIADIFKIVLSVVRDLKVVIDKSVNSRIKIDEFKYQLNDLNLIECIDDVLSKRENDYNKDESYYEIEYLV
ncbi:uncharacterized protein HGUI_02574 [Hanseniaspora guilliermondii]|uniref:pyridoxal kinase n=1 Tax=Hanseniaspora guilliermondii TaxID=56406 RepID=A0A1L0FLE9_9ASCO|nr:uncharacterized protein HGUI_02574 [Hanseniaspora guilliermondii]